ncbi:MAG: cardiolipin synthase [Edaphocola sp.]
MKALWQLMLHHYSTISLTFVVLIAVFTILRIIRDTKDATKTLAYILLVFLVPVLGSIIYFSFGVNYRKRKLFSKKIATNDRLFAQMEQSMMAKSRKIIAQEQPLLQNQYGLANQLLTDAHANISYNKVSLLINGEQKFPEVLAALAAAKHFIHLEYYIFEDDDIGNSIIDILKEKALSGVAVRMIYDDFGSHGLQFGTLADMRAAGIEVLPFFEVKFYLLANRINYRDHRKIIIVDGKVGFTGGINVADKYLNKGDTAELYWRDTHLMIEGAAVNSLQYHFIANWNFCTGQTLALVPNFFSQDEAPPHDHKDLVQIVAGGPDYPTSTIMLTFFSAISNAQEKIYITSPYFIPNDSINDALKAAALSGKDVRLLLPGISDSKLVNAAAHSYFNDLLASGVRIYLYQKGFVHAKTLVADHNLGIIGTANMDVRSFDLNFEINAVIYGRQVADALTATFFNDLNYAEEIDYARWQQRKWWNQLGNDVARMLSPLL